jgi:hypothetical protein
MLLKNDEAPVVVEVVSEGDDEDEDEDDDEGESASAPETLPASSSLSPFAPPFIPECCTEGRPKSRRWAEDSVDSGEVGTDEESSPKSLTYLDVVRRQPRPVSPRLQGHNCAPSWSVARMAQLAGRAVGLEAAKRSGGASAVSRVHSLSMGFPSAVRAMGPSLVGPPEDRAAGALQLAAPSLCTRCGRLAEGAGARASGRLHRTEDCSNVFGAAVDA